MPLPPINTDSLVTFLADLFNTTSPTGDTWRAMQLVEKKLQSLSDLELEITRKGALVAGWQGTADSNPRALTAHVDTLGAMVKEIKSNGRLKLTKLGGFAWNTVEGEGCTVLTHAGKSLRGSILLAKSSSHVYGAKVAETKRDDDNMEVRLDERTTNEDETRELGIGVGDFVSFD